MHEYVKGVADCMCEDADSHAPCLECGAAAGAYIHVGDAAVSSVEVSDDDDGSTVEVA